MDYTDTSAFIAALTGADGWRTPVTFQTFDEQKPKRDGFARIRHGSLERFANKLAEWNAEGCGIFVMVNAGDGRGRTTQNVVQLRALFIDEDGPTKCPYKLAPSILVRSARGEHAYWLLEPGAALDRFTGAQKQLAKHYGSDPTISDLPRVMRLPGFAHMKATPTPVALMHADALRRYTIDAVVGAHPVRAPKRRKANPVLLTDDPLARVQTYVAWAACRPVHEGVRNTTAFSIAAEGFRRGLPHAVVESVVSDYCFRAGIADETQPVIRSAARYHHRHRT